MYLHIGQDTVVRSDDILGIFDIDSTSVSPITKEFLASAQQSGCVVNVTDDLPKSYIVCIPGKEKSTERSKVYISQISTSTLCKRAGSDEIKGFFG